LNEYVQVDIYKGEINREYLENSNFTCVVVCDAHITDLVELNEICHKKNIKFIAAESRGLCGMIFCDFGRDFEVTDPDGEPPQSAIVVGITNDNPGVVTVHDDKRHGLYTGDYVIFEGVEGMEELNNQKPMQITVTGPYTFTICDTTKFGKYTSGGFVKQVKQPQVFSYASLKEALENPKFLDTDFSKIGRPAELHVAFQALGEYVKTYKELPR
jgi:ubiquitin-activating enzyme E1